MADDLDEELAGYVDPGAGLPSLGNPGSSPAKIPYGKRLDGLHGGAANVYGTDYPMPKKPKMLSDLEWAYENLGRPAALKCYGQRKAFVEDLLADRVKTLGLLEKLQREYKAEMKAWFENKLMRKREKERWELEMARASGGGDVVVDLGESGVRELIARLLVEAAGGDGGSTGARAL